MSSKAMLYGLAGTIMQKGCRANDTLVCAKSHLPCMRMYAGTAKSELARRLTSLVQGAYFERLLTRFSVPEELFGPLSMRGGYNGAGVDSRQFNRV